MLNPKNPFSQNYVEARQRFLKAAQSVNANLKSQLISSRGAQGEELTIDIATVGAENPERTILLTSGLHGVEGCLGSAIQTAWLEKLRVMPISFDTTAVVLVHALNPYGFSWQRRVNENNVDLNRNFIFPQQQFCGSHPGLKNMPWLQRPVSPDNKLFILELHTLWTILSMGFSTMKNSIHFGQFDYPSGLFWGGHKYEETTQIIQDQIDSWTRQTQHILHIDYHTGIGKYGRCHFLTFGQKEIKKAFWFLAQFGAGVSTVGTEYFSDGKPVGSMADWLVLHFGEQKKQYIYLAAEYGTYSSLRAFKALYQENRFWDHPGYEHESAKKELIEFFCPTDPVWRERCVTDGLLMISKALQIIREFP